jgi:peptidoglycan/xylan/chitin deacetylase (PgdA/CDA1 family)
MNIKPFLVTLVFMLAVVLSAWMPAMQNQVVVASGETGMPPYGENLVTLEPATSFVSPESIPLPTATIPLSETLSLDVEVTPVLTDSLDIPLEQILAATPEPHWVWNPPGEATVPILMYHHIAETDSPSQYFVSPQDFELQIRSLKEWGYISISLTQLVQAVENGAELPPRPVILTFDDGYMDVYENAFPVLQKYGFTGVTYIIVQQLEIGGFQHLEQLKEMLSAGWEVGSHTYSHSDLRQAGVNLKEEINNSKQTLETLLEVPVKTFSFPYGTTTSYVTQLVREAGYETAVGLGGFYKHVPKTLYYLSRIEVQGSFNLVQFEDLLPWAGSVELPETNRHNSR